MHVVVLTPLVKCREGFTHVLSDIVGYTGSKSWDLCFQLNYFQLHATV